MQEQDERAEGEFDILDDFFKDIAEQVEAEQDDKWQEQQDEQEDEFYSWRSKSHLISRLEPLQRHDWIEHLEAEQHHDQEVVEDEQYSFDVQISQSIPELSMSMVEMDERQSQETSTITAEVVDDDNIQQDEQDERAEVVEMHESQEHQMLMVLVEREELEQVDQHQLVEVVEVVLGSIK